jgi:pyruvate kinase
MPSTKIVATLGPSTDQPPYLKRMFDAGVDVFRLNTSHGTWEDHLARIASVRAAAAEAKVHAGILLDLQGPKIRLGLFEGGRCDLEAGAIFTITTEQVQGTSALACTSYSNFARDVKPGDAVLLDDGSLELKALASDGVSVRCEVITGGPLGDHKGINLPGVELSTPSLTRKDMDDLQRGLQAGIDFVALSFVRKATDLVRLKLFLEERGAQIPVIAKIEKPEGWKNLEQILDESDGVMVARGDLGVEMALEKVPFIQKQIIERARAKGKFVITATQMLESMIEHPNPTRAEVSDVANAICDGTDAVMLSAETAKGKYPGRAVKMMVRIATETESWLRPQGFHEPLPPLTPSNAEIIAEAAYRAARSAGVAAIVVFTSSGASARLISRMRPPVPIYAFTQSESVARQLTISFGVTPILTPDITSTDQMLLHMEQALVNAGRLQPTDNVVFVAGQPIGRVGSTNLIKLHRLGGSQQATHS